MVYNNMAYLLIYVLLFAGCTPFFEEYEELYSRKLFVPNKLFSFCGYRQDKICGNLVDCGNKKYFNFVYFDPRRFCEDWIMRFNSQATGWKHWIKFWQFYSQREICKINPPQKKTFTGTARRSSPNMPIQFITPSFTIHQTNDKDNFFFGDLLLEKLDCAGLLLLGHTNSSPTSSGCLGVLTAHSQAETNRFVTLYAYFYVSNSNNL